MNVADNFDQTIVHDIGQYTDYPFEAISPDALALLRSSEEHLNYDRRSAMPAIRAFEVYLRITNQKFNIATFSSKKFETIVESFFGAIYSDVLIKLNIKRQYVYCSTFYKILKLSCSTLILKQPMNYLFSNTRKTLEIERYVTSFLSLERNQEEVYLCRGWFSTNRTGRRTTFPFYRIYKLFGRCFTDNLHKACDEYYRTRKTQRIIALNDLVNFIFLQSPTPTLADFKNTDFMTEFWFNFFNYYIRINYEKGIRVNYLVTNWRNECLFFIKNFLIKSGVFAEPNGDLPSPPIRNINYQQTNIEEDSQGIAIKTKLITHIPLEITDKEAIEILFLKIENDFTTITNWAKWAANEIFSRYKFILNNSNTGAIRHFNKPQIISDDPADYLKWITNRLNPDHVINAATNFRYYGYTTEDDICLRNLYPQPRKYAANLLALPVTGSLLPHCILLIANHPEITPSFLENLVLYDKNSRRVGLIKTDSGYILNGTKNRAGPNEGFRSINLNRQTARIVFELILLTNPLRKYLRQKGDDNWRYLLLTSGLGFAYPRRISRLATDTSEQSRINKLADSLGNTSTLNYEARLDLATRFSLPALRASAATLVYLRNKNITKMSKSLGHKEYCPSLIDRYLPKSIRIFFEERWVRIFQEGIIVESLKESKFLLEASSFKNLDELHMFLEAHTLNISAINQLKSVDLSPSKKSLEINKISFGVNEKILTLLISLQLAIKESNKPISMKAQFWSDVAEGLVQHIDSQICIRPDLKNYLALAKKNACPRSIAHLIDG